jgi:protocatechuate 3,4-dioxygenase alpha subunit
VSLRATTSQTVGPFFALGLAWLNRSQLAGSGVSGERVTLAGRVLDGDGAPVPDAVIEIWQANAHGKYAHPEDLQDKPLEPGFSGYGRTPTDAEGRFRFETVKPGSVPGPEGEPQAPHIAVSVFTRGLLLRLTTRIYFPDEPGNTRDFVLGLVEPERRDTLIAQRTAEPGRLEWNIVLQGPGETVFFDC